MSARRLEVRAGTNEVIPSLKGADIYFYRGGEVWRKAGDEEAPLLARVRWNSWDVFDDGICYFTVVLAENAPACVLFRSP